VPKVPRLVYKTEFNSIEESITKRLRKGINVDGYF